MGMDTSPHDIFFQVGLWKWVFSAHGCAMNLGSTYGRACFPASLAVCARCQHLVGAMALQRQPRPLSLLSSGQWVWSHLSF